MKWTRRHGIRIRGLWAPDMLLAAAALVAAVRVNEVKGSIMILATCALVTQRRCADRVRNEDRWNMDGEKERKMIMFALPSSLPPSHSA